MPHRGTRGQKRFNAHPLLRRHSNFFPQGAGEVDQQELGKGKGRDGRKEGVLQQPHSFNPFIPYRSRVVPVYQWGIRHGRLTGWSQEEIKRGRQSGGKRRARQELLALLSGNGINTRSMNGSGPREVRAPRREGKGPVVLTSS